MPVGSPLTALAGAPIASAGAPGWPHAVPPRLWHCLVLAALMHALLVALIGTAPGGTATPGQGVWGRINVVLDIGLRGPGERAGVGESTPPPGPSTEGPRGPARTERVGGAVRPPPVQPLPDQPGAQREGRWQATESPPPATADASPAVPAEPRIAEPVDRSALTEAAPPPAPDALMPMPPPDMRTAPAVQLESTDLPPAVPPVRPPLPGAPPIAQPEPPPVALPTPTRRTPAPVRLSDADAPPALATARPAAPEPPPVAMPEPAPLPAPARRAVAPVDLAPADRVLPPTTGPAAARTLPTVVAAPESPSTAVAAPTAAAAPAAAATTTDAERPPRPTPSTTATAPTSGAAATAGTPGPALQAPGSPLAGARVGHDVATPPSVPPSAPPRLNLDYMRPSGGALAAQPRRGALALMPAPPERKSKLAEGIEQAAKPDCRTAYAGAGLAAVVPLAMDAARGKGCKW